MNLRHCLPLRRNQLSFHERISSQKLALLVPDPAPFQHSIPALPRSLVFLGGENTFFVKSSGLNFSFRSYEETSMGLRRSGIGPYEIPLVPYGEPSRWTNHPRWHPTVTPQERSDMAGHHSSYAPYWPTITPLASTSSYEPPNPSEFITSHSASPFLTDSNRELDNRLLAVASGMTQPVPEGMGSGKFHSLPAESPEKGRIAQSIPREARRTRATTINGVSSTLIEMYAPSNVPLSSASSSDFSNSVSASSSSFNALARSITEVDDLGEVVGRYGTYISISISLQTSIIKLSH
jgi:hypothetical protein